MAKRAQPTEWWQSYFDAQYLLEYEPLFSLERDRVEVARLIDVLGLPAGSRVLDVPCGQGRHAHLLAEAGFDVVGLDYSPIRCSTRARARGTGPRLRYRRGDMRRLPAQWRGRFDAVLNLFTSFGFFTNPRDDRAVIAEFARVLAPGRRPRLARRESRRRHGALSRPRLVDDAQRDADRPGADVRSAVRAAHGRIGMARAATAQGTREHRIRLVHADASGRARAPTSASSSSRRSTVLATSRSHARRAR